MDDNSSMTMDQIITLIQTDPKVLERLQNPKVLKMLRNPTQSTSGRGRKRIEFTHEQLQAKLERARESKRLSYHVHKTDKTSPPVELRIIQPAMIST